MSQRAMSMPLSAVARTIPFACQKCWRYIICQRCSIRVGSSPIRSCERSSMAPVTARVCHSSVASPHPASPGWSVTTLTKIQLRIRALQTSVSIFAIFTTPCLRGSVASCDDLGDGFAEVDLQPLAARHFELAGVEPELVKHRRVEVGDVVALLDGVEAQLVGRAVGDAALHAAA